MDNNKAVKAEEFVTIAQTENYLLMVGVTQDGEKCYQIINKKYKVKETETFILSQGLTYLQTLETSLKAVLLPHTVEDYGV